MRRTLALIALLALPLGAFAACGGDDDDGGTSSDTTGGGAPAADADLTVVAENVQFTEDSYTAAAGEMTIGYQNEDSVRHTLLIEDIDEGEFKLETDGGATDSGSIELEAGEYELFCDVPGHASMRATLTVE